MKLFSFLFDFLSTILEKCDMFAILNEITEILSQIFLKFPAEKDFFPSILLNNLNDFKNMSKGHLYNFILFFLSKIIFVNSDNSYSELIEINDFLYLSIENEDDAILMASYLNINIKIYQNESYQEHHSQILANIVAIFERIMDHNIFKHCLPIVIISLILLKLFLYF